MDGKSVLRNILEIIKFGDEVFIIEINLDYSDDEENSIEFVYIGNYCNEIDLL